MLKCITVSFIMTAVLYCCNCVGIGSQSFAAGLTSPRVISGQVSGAGWYLDLPKEEMRRRQQECEEGEIKKPKLGNWSLGLLESMKDPHLIIKESKDIVVIKDKYPKATYHYLVIPKEQIDSIFKLNESHVDLLEKFGVLFEELKQKHEKVKLRAGFHAVPSMQRLHMHVISSDMLSPCLKTKTHWNSFTTSFFIPYQDLLRELKENGSTTRISEDQHKMLLATPLKCNQCDFGPKNMPRLKEHLLNHL